MGYREHEFRRLDQIEMRRRPMNLRPRDHSNPELRFHYVDGLWKPRKLTYHQTQERIHRGVSRKCTRCLGSGHYFNAQCEVCSGWGVNMVMRGHYDLSKSTREHRRTTGE